MIYEGSLLMFITSFGEQNITYKCCSNFLIHLFTFIICLTLAFFAGKYKARQEIQEDVSRIEAKMEETTAKANEQLKKEKMR